LNQVDRLRAGRSLLLPALLLSLLASAPTARSHIVYGTKTLSQFVAEADVVARARVVDADAVLVLEGEGKRRPLVVAELLEVMKGPAEPGPVRFAQHGHGVADFEDGEEVLLFLERTEHHRELSKLGGAEGVLWVSLQEHAAKFLLTPGSRDAILIATRSYLQVADAAPDERYAALRKATFAQLSSPDPRLASSAVRDIALAEDPPLVTGADLPVLEPVLASASTPIGVRVALLAELERRELLDGPPRWVALLRATEGRELRSVIAAAGTHPSLPVHAVLLEILAGNDADAAAAAAISLGWPGNEQAVPPLRGTLASLDSRLRMASIRGLGRIATPSARKVLEEAAASHPDAGTRRRARAEAARMQPDG
jgi:hypothetical protein